MLFYTLGLQFYQKRLYLSEEKKPEKKQNSTTIMISVGGKGTVFPVKMKLQGELFV